MFYVILAIICLGGLGIWVEIIKGQLGQSADDSGLLTALSTFFPALIGSASLQLILSSTGNSDKVLVSFSLLACFVSFFGVVLITIFYPVHPAWSLGAAVWFGIFAVWFWWFTNGDELTYQNAPIGRRFRWQHNPSGEGKPERIQGRLMDIQFPFTVPALRVDQRLGSFYVAVLPAELLLRVCASDRMSASLNPDGVGYSLEGTQRVIQDKRLSEIASYINRVDSAFPNSIIVAANYDRETGFDQTENEDIAEEEGEQPNDVSSAWNVQVSDDGCHKLTIPSEAKLAAVIDGQHRLFSFAKANPEALRSMNLICSIFIDLPKALQAQIFATINSTQKRVDRSLTFELFGYNVSDEPEEY